MTAMREAIDAAILAEMMRQNIHGDSDMRAVTTAALTAIRAAGMVIVPAIPTEAMIMAVLEIDRRPEWLATVGTSIRTIYAAMLDAAFAEMAGEK